MAIKHSSTFLKIQGQNYKFRRYFFSGKQTLEQGLYTPIIEAEVTGFFTKDRCVTSTERVSSTDFLNAVGSLILLQKVRLKSSKENPYKTLH